MRGENKTRTKQIEITKYTDYVTYLSDLIKYKKENHNFSYRSFCQKSGFKSPSYLKWVVEGKRPISLKSVHKFIHGLSLDKRDAEYFMLMVNYKEAKDPQSKRYYYEQMLVWQKRHVSIESKDTYEYLSHWYYLAIHELVGSKGFKDDPRWIRDRLGSDLTVWDIKNGLDTLERLKLIKRNTKGNWEQTSKNIHTEAEVRSIAAYSYHAEMLNVAQDVLNKRKAEERHFQSLVALVDKETYKKIKQMTQVFQQKVVTLLQEEENHNNKKGAQQELYALNMHMLPLTVHKGDK